MEHAERPTAELASPPGHKRSLHSLIPLAAAGALALVAWGFAWMQSQNTLNEASRTSRSLSVLVSLSDVERGLLHSDLHALASILNVAPVAPMPWSGYGLQDQSLAELKRLTANNQDQQTRWSQLRLTLDRHQRLLETSVQLAERGNQEGARRLLNGQANASRASILGQLRAMTRQEKQLLLTRSLRLNQQRQGLQILQALSLVAMLLLVSVNLVLLRRERQARNATLGALASSEQRFRDLFENASVGMAITTLPTLASSATTLEANEAVATMLGYSRAELKTLNLDSLCDPEEPKNHAAGLASLLDGSKPSARLVQCYRHRNGQNVWVDEGLVLRHNNSDASLELITIMLNITALKTAEQTLLEKVHYTRSLIETSIDPLVTISPAGTIEDVNEATVLATGLPRGALQGRNFADFFTEPERARQGYQHAFQRGSVRDYPLTPIPAEILTKPTRLSPEELALVRTHAEAGYEALRPIQFPWPVAEAVRQHHERLDGSGYPRGLKGDQISLEARILAVADTVEAMATNRPYRQAPGIEAALAAVVAEQGQHYDPEPVAACLRLFREQNFCFAPTAY